MKFKISVFFCIAAILMSFRASAATLTFYPVWTYTSNSAGTCYYEYPTLSPLSVPRTLIVDNHLTNNTVLYSWSYVDFAPNIHTYCQSNGTSDLIHTSNAAPEVVFKGAFNTGSNSVSTNIPGIGIKYYVMPIYAAGPFPIRSECVGYSVPTVMRVPIGTENAVGSSFMVRFYADPITQSSCWPMDYSPAKNNATYSIRAELVKTGPVTYTTTPLAPAQTPVLRATNYMEIPLPDLIGSGGITIISPGCRLETKDYIINLGRWGTSPSVTGLPFSGPATEIGLKLECSGQPENVYFRFEDTGTSPLANKNISLYDNSGNKIDGLEAEMLYNGTHVDVDNITKTNTGTHGTTRTNPEDLAFNILTSTSQFSARFVQRSQITKSGASYTGLVTGKINMYVTYQ